MSANEKIIDGGSENTIPLKWKSILLTSGRDFALQRCQCMAVGSLQWDDWLDDWFFAIDKFAKDVHAITSIVGQNRIVSLIIVHRIDMIRNISDLEMNGWSSQIKLLLYRRDDDSQFALFGDRIYWCLWSQQTSVSVVIYWSGVIDCS